MNRYVYMVRRSWYDEYSVFGIYETADAARAAMQQYFDIKTKKNPAHSYRWKNKKTASEHFFSKTLNEEYQNGEFKIIRVPLNKWSKKTEDWKNE